jgi:hypothetical protein
MYTVKNINREAFTLEDSWIPNKLKLAQLKFKKAEKETPEDFDLLISLQEEITNLSSAMAETVNRAAEVVNEEGEIVPAEKLPINIMKEVLNQAVLSESEKKV